MQMGMLKSSAASLFVQQQRKKKKMKNDFEIYFKTNSVFIIWPSITQCLFGQTLHYTHE